MWKKIRAYLAAARRDANSAKCTSGWWGEEIAATALRRKGCNIIGRRVRVGRDEIDIIARQGKTLLFVEVKTRASEDFGRPAAAVNHRKRQCLARAAVRYLRHQKQRSPYFRFDVMEIIGETGDPSPQVRHIENAFPLPTRYRVS